MSADPSKTQVVAGFTAMGGLVVGTFMSAILPRGGGRGFMRGVAVISLLGLLSVVVWWYMDKKKQKTPSSSSSPSSVRAKRQAQVEALFAEANASSTQDVTTTTRSLPTCSGEHDCESFGRDGMECYEGTGSKRHPCKLIAKASAKLCGCGGGGAGSGRRMATLEVPACVPGQFTCETDAEADGGVPQCWHSVTSRPCVLKA